ncbi:hypothetical protein JQC72_12095 [Polycladomyces sp. WAk]|uniref:Uncharacterized protein n=1 Tax=Polycladomyces zharkentensis TaxID=2807616 RepID=A0ABS2WL48_9BACL|nr:hypothetical protein [Polycladomyces sp. WAk]MBN2910242.1 hypothetical protein [Polycladomyces sp. WAk]
MTDFFKSEGFFNQSLEQRGFSEISENISSSNHNHSPIEFFFLVLELSKAAYSNLPAPSLKSFEEYLWTIPVYLFVISEEIQDRRQWEDDLCATATTMMKFFEHLFVKLITFASSNTIYNLDSKML